MRTASGYDDSKSSSSPEVPGQLVDIGDQFSARYESKIQPTQVALNGDVQPLPVGDDGHRVGGGRFGALEIPAYSARGRFEITKLNGEMRCGLRAWISAADPVVGARS